MKVLLIIDIIAVILTYLSSNYCENTNGTELLIRKLKGGIIKRFFIAGLIKLITIILICTTIAILILNFL